MARHPVVTLLTDFGTTDPYVPEMKGIILSICPEATLVDITHEIRPGDVLSAAFILRQAMPCFPPGTAHCVVVDPGVGTERKILAAQYAGQLAVFPDNGVITFVDRDLPLAQIVVVRNDRYYSGLPISATFHGRDIFAPVAAHLCAGLPLDRLGPPAGTFKLLEIPAPAAAPSGRLTGQVIYVDRFGNLISNISAQLLRETCGESVPVAVFCAGKEIRPLQATYGFVEAGKPLALINSMGLVEIAINGGRACNVLSAGIGTEVRVVRAAK